MGCEIVNPEIVYRGEDKTLLLKFKDSNEDPYDLTGATEITVRFRKEDDSVLSKTLTGGGVVVISAEAGTAEVSLSDTETALLKTGERQSVTAYVDVSAIRRIADFPESLTIRDPSV
jgi:hypothetical protein